jgi:hypothetical protein
MPSLKKKNKQKKKKHDAKVGKYRAEDRAILLAFLCVFSSSLFS